MIEKIKKWVEERDEMLEKRSVKEMIAFVEKWEKKGVYKKGMAKRIKKMSEWVQKASLCKMICNATKVSRESKEWAEKWLYEHGSTPIVF